MESILSPEGSLALAISSLVVVLGWRFTLPERGRDSAGVLVFVVAVILAFAAGRGLIPRGGSMTAGPMVRIGGAALLVAGLLLAGASFKARLRAGRGRLAAIGPYARIRHPLYAGLGLALVGHLLRFPSEAGAIAATIALSQYVWLGMVEERDARAAFGAEWREYEARTRALLPIPRRTARES